MNQPQLFINLEEIKTIIAKYELIKKQRRESCNKYYHKTKGDFQKSYYLKNKDKLLKTDRDAKKEKYNNDPVYRAMILERMKVYRINKKLKKASDEEIIKEL